MSWFRHRPPKYPPEPQKEPSPDTFWPPEEK